MDQTTITEWAVDQIAALAGLKSAEVETDQPIMSLGIDSAAIAALSARLSDFLGRSIEPTFLFEYPTIEKAASALAQDLKRDITAPVSRKSHRGQSIAIVGIACRMPRARDKEEFWHNLLNGVDCVTAPPPERWALNADPTDLVRETSPMPPAAGFISDVDAFAAAFFRFSPAEAQAMDPQQRLLLEVGWEALEDAGCAPSKLRGANIGVFVGISHSDYGRRIRGSAGAAAAFTGTGNSLAVAANRLSYVFDFRGPSIAVDTACSSSLTATHLAAQSIASGECDAAMVAGVNLLLDAEVTDVLNQAGMLSPDARCKPFDSRANGYVRGEGCGVVLLKPLSAAIEDGDRIYAILEATTVGQDGRSNGLTAPNPAAQEALLREAHARAGVSPEQVEYIEAHGTGTRLGDPIEISALSRVLCLERAIDRPLLVGSVKSNIGHLEAAAGIAGLIKTALSIYHGVIPGNLHYQKPNPNINSSARMISIAERTMPWPGESADRISGVSSFGFGGANAHVVLRAFRTASKDEPRATNDGPAELVMMSAKSATALRSTADSWARWLSSPAAASASLADIAHTATTREKQPVRRGFVAGSIAELRQQLESFARVETQTGKVRAHPRVIYVFPGQGDHWANIDWSGYASDPLFWSTIQRCDEALRSVRPEGSLELALRSSMAAPFSDPSTAQPCIYALQMAFVAVLRAHGIEPHAVIGHSVGEIAAAAACGTLSLADGARLAFHRGRSMSLPSCTGAALAVSMTESQAQTMIGGSDTLGIAAINSPRAVTISGDRQLLEHIFAEHSRDEKTQTRWVSQSFGFHSPLMSEAAATLERELEWLHPAQGRCDFISTVTGRKTEGQALDGRYWARNVRQTVRFEDAIRAVELKEGDIVIEIAPRPVLRSAIRDISAATGAIAVLSTVEDANDPGRSLLLVTQKLFEAGLTIRRRLTTGKRPRRADLPPTSWDRARYWGIDHSRTGSRPGRTGSGRMLAAPEAGIEVWQFEIGGHDQASLAQHQVNQRPIAPAAAQLAAILPALQADGGPIELQDGHFLSPIDLGQGPAVTRLVVVGSRLGSRTAYLYAQDPATASQETIASRFIVAAAVSHSSDEATTRAQIQQRLSQHVSSRDLYRSLARLGLSYGPAFQLAQDIRAGDGQAFGRIRLPEDTEFSQASLDPRVLDGALHLLFAAAQTLRSIPSSAEVPVGFSRFKYLMKPVGVVYAHAQIQQGSHGRSGTVRLLDETGNTFIRIEGIRFAPMPRARGEDGLSVYGVDWYPSREEGRVEGLRRATVIMAGSHPVAGLVAERSRSRGDACITVARDGSKTIGPDIAIPSNDTGHIQNALREAAALLRSDIDCVLCLWPLDNRAPDAILQNTIDALSVIKATSLAPFVRPPRLIFVTAGTHSKDEDAAAGATIWGLSKAVPFENPALTCRCIDLADDDLEAQATALLDEVRAEDTETEVLWRNGVRNVRRVIASPSPPPATLRLDPNGLHIVTGANGALGSRVLRWLAERGARHILGIGRSPSPHRLDDFPPAGVEFSYVAADLGDREALLAGLTQAGISDRKVHGIVHAAGVLSDGPLLNMSPADVETVLRAKVLGLLNLVALYPPAELEFMVLFSSAAAVLGSPGQANYCAANAFLDAYAVAASRRHRNVLSIGWGPWSDGGMATTSEGAVQQMTAGLSYIAPALGMDFLDRAIAANAAHQLVLPFELGNLAQYYPEGPGFHLFDELLKNISTVLRSAGRSSAIGRRPNISTAFVEPRTDTERTIASIWQRALGLDRVGVDDGFFDLGGDSVIGNQILVEIGRRTGISIEPAEAFQAFTVAGLATLTEARLFATIEAMSEEEARAEIG
ncbi:SDR family NAD(P)-dependent oxidoreductase [Bradyrhizobium sp. SZCCHNR2035]|uniref:SDR family NAD(P)-dependent oxidoreductase n=1 Tax=Bradyrhizobium sp. SZCCHNR2035 TaxID=3057386 RepID=UPI00291677F6|nr:SDR family NAD(P)-dependent oxidoreductase [Bradyrhizobium sp. SZCCHNR2035]